MEIQVNVHDWLALKMQTRIKLREVFAIPKSKGSLVEGNVVKSDGTTHEDLQAVTLAKMQEYLGSENGTPGGDFAALFNACVDKIEEIDKEMEKIPEPPDPKQVVLEEWAALLARMQNQSQQLAMTEQFNALIIKFSPNEPSRPQKPQRGSKAK